MYRDYIPCCSTHWFDFQLWAFAACLFQLQKIEILASFNVLFFLKNVFLDLNMSRNMPYFKVFKDKSEVWVGCNE